MTTKPTTKTYHKLEILLSSAGLSVVAVGLIASLYGTYASLRFIHGISDLGYYLGYFIILGGGFLVGYILSRRQKNATRQATLFAGVLYAMLSMSVYWILDALRIILQDSFGPIAPTWAESMFEIIPFLSIAIALIIGLFAHYILKQSIMGLFAKTLLITLFTAHQLYILIPYLTLFDPIAAKLIIVGILVSPISVMVPLYFVLGNIKPLYDRVFYAVLLATFYTTFGAATREFSADVSRPARISFYLVTTAIALLFIGIVAWKAREAAESDALHAEVVK